VAPGQRAADPADGRDRPVPPEPGPDSDEDPLGRPDAVSDRTRRIDESLVRLTAAHEGLPLAPRERATRDDGADELPDPVEDELPPGPATPRELALRWAAVVAAVVVFVAMTIGWSSKTWVDGRIRQVAALDPESGAGVDADAQAGDQNVLFLGLDQGDGAFVPGAGSDTIVVAHLPADGGPVTRIAFPRDLEINRPPCQRWDQAAATYLDQTVPAETRTKLDTAFQVGGPGCAVRVVQQLTGLSITGFVAVDVSGLGAMADALGGVPVCLDRPVLDSVLGPVAPTAGSTTVAGATASGIARARHVQGDPATDQGLVERQQRLVAAVLDRALSTATLLDPWEIRAFGRVFGQATIADGVDADQLLSVADALRGTGPNAGPFITVPTTGEVNTRGNSVLRDRDAGVLFKALRTGSPIPADATAAPDPAATLAPSAVTLDVLNASDRSGLAGQVADTLRALSFAVGHVANAPQPAADTLIRFSPDRAAEAQVLAAAVPSARSVPDATASGVLQLVLGNSFDGTLRAVAPQAPAAPATPPASAGSCG
jgi:LCP family protein required for cell wall assembly